MKIYIKNMLFYKMAKKISASQLKDLLIHRDEGSFLYLMRQTLTVIIVSNVKLIQVEGRLNTKRCDLKLKELLLL